MVVLNIVIFLVLCGSSLANKCYRCEDALSHEDCSSQGLTCTPSGEESCITVIRKENNIFAIDKSCKQTTACNNLEIQNQYLCKNDNTSADVSICFYCCRGNLCNDVIGENSKMLNSNNIIPKPTKKPERHPKVVSMSQGARLKLANDIAKSVASVKTETITKIPKRISKVLKNKTRIILLKNMVSMSKSSLAIPRGTSARLWTYPTSMNQNPMQKQQSEANFVTNKASGNVASTCGIPKVSNITLQRLGVWPTGASILVEISDTANAVAGWAVLLIFSKPLPSNCTINVWSSTLVEDKTNRQVYLIVNRDHNADISSHSTYNITFVVDKCPPYFQVTLNQGFYDYSLTNGTCKILTTTVAPGSSTTPTPTPRTTPFSSMTTITMPTTNAATSISAGVTTLSPAGTTVSPAGTTVSPAGTTVSPTGTTVSPTGTTISPTTTSVVPSSSCQYSPDSYSLSGPAYLNNNGKMQINSFVALANGIGVSNANWTVKLIFNVPVQDVLSWKLQTFNYSADGRVWIMKPVGPFFRFIKLYFDIIVTVDGRSPLPVAAVFFCPEASNVDLTLPSDVQFPYGATPLPPLATTTNAAVTTLAPDRCSGGTGFLPPVSRPTVINFKPSPPTDNLKFDYNELLHKSILFYEAQRSGKVPANSRVLWRGDSGLHDGCNVGVDLTGGWYNGIDNVKYGFPMASAVTILAWGIIEFPDAYEDAGEMKNALNSLRWATDYLIKVHSGIDEIWGQVGDPLVDQSVWTRPEQLNTSVPTYLLNSTNPGSDLAGETAAALAASSIVFKATDPLYSATMLLHAMQLYDFANRYRGKYDASIPNADRFYPSVSGFEDELVWACLWLYMATGNQTYLFDGQNKMLEFNLINKPFAFSWDNKQGGIEVLLAKLVRDTNTKMRFRGDVENFLNNLIMSPTTPRTPAGLIFLSNYGTNGLAANAAFLALVAANKIQPKLPNSYWYNEFARQQIHAMLGDGDGGISYVVGFGYKPPTQPFHPASSCPKWSNPPVAICNQTAFESKDSNPHVLYGAVVSGPDLAGFFDYNRKNFINNEVSINYNAGFQSAVAGLKHLVILSRKP